MSQNASGSKYARDQDFLAASVPLLFLPLPTPFMDLYMSLPAFVSNSSGYNNYHSITTSYAPSITQSPRHPWARWLTEVVIQHNTYPKSNGLFSLLLWSFSSVWYAVRVCVLHNSALGQNLTLFSSPWAILSILMISIIVSVWMASRFPPLGLTCMKNFDSWL